MSTVSEIMLSLRPGVTAALLPDSRCAVFDGRAEYLFNGSLFFELCETALEPISVYRLLKTRRYAPLANAIYALKILREKGIIVEARPVISNEFASHDSFNRFRQPVELTGAWSPGLKDVFLRKLGVKQEAHPESYRLRPKVILHLGGSYLEPSMTSAALATHDPGALWIPIGCIGQSVWVGPLMEAEKCIWRALQKRLSETRPIEAWARSTAHRIITAPNSSPYLDKIICNACSEIPTWIEDGVNFSTLRSHGGALGKFETHSLRRLLHNAATVSEAAIRLLRSSQTAVVKPRLGGTRSIEASLVLDRIKAVVDPIVGIVTESRDVSSGPYQYVYHAEAIVPKRSDGKKSTPRPLRIEAAGKGLAKIQAEVGSISEAIERYCCVFQGNENIVFDEAVGHRRKISLDSLLHYSLNQYEERMVLNSKYSGLFHVCKPPSAASSTHWAAGWSLTEQEEILLPAMSVYFYYDLADAVALDFRADSNGCAAGATVADATLQGLYELIERDATAIWWYQMAVRGFAALDGEALKVFSDVAAGYKSVGRAFHVLDITVDNEVPVFCAISYRRDGRGIGFGLGCHLDSKIALERAVSELNQFLVVMEAPVVSGGWSPAVRFAKEWFDVEKIDNHSFLLGDRDRQEVRKFTESEFSFVEGEINCCVERLRHLGVEIIVVDLSRAECPLSVVRVVSPQLRHFWPRFGRGRLFEAFPQHGVDSAKDEKLLNPIPFFL